MRQRQQVELGHYPCHGRRSNHDRGISRRRQPTAAEATTTAGETPTTAAEAAPTVDFSKLSGQPGRQRRYVPEELLRRRHRRRSPASPPTSPSSTAAAARARADRPAGAMSSTSPAPTAWSRTRTRPKYKGGEFVYVPTVIAPITMSYNLPSVDKLQLSPTSIAAIFQREITKWNDPLIAADNPGVTLARHRHRRGTCGPTARAPPRTSPSSSTQLPDPTAGGDVEAGCGHGLEWPADTQAGDGNSGVAQIVSSTEGAIGYVDLSDAKANNLMFASVKNKAGKYIEPTLDATTAAAENAKINDDLTFFLGWADGDAAYPIAAQTWIIAYTKQADPAKAEALRGFLTYLLTDGQKAASDDRLRPAARATCRPRRWPTSPRSAPDESIYSWAGPPAGPVQLGGRRQGDS